MKEFDLKFKGVGYNNIGKFEGELMKEMVWCIMYWYFIVNIFIFEFFGIVFLFVYYSKGGVVVYNFDIKL